MHRIYYDFLAFKITKTLFLTLATETNYLNNK